MESFVNDSAIAPLIHPPSIAWQEKRYIGEDFAGLDEYADFVSPRNEPPALSAEITRPHDETEHHGANANTTDTPLAAVALWKNAMAMGSAAAILIAAVLGGLWAAHATAPGKSSHSLPDGNAKAWTAHRSALPQTR